MSQNISHRDPKEIMDLADHHNCKHIYFGTSQSYNGDGKFATVMKELLENKYWVTLDFGIEYIEKVTETGLMKFERFIPIVSAKIPNIYKLNKNTTLKIDDVTWGHSNTGVWSKNLKAITENMHYTDWSEYVGDTNRVSCEYHLESPFEAANRSQRRLARSSRKAMS